MSLRTARGYEYGALTDPANVETAVGPLASDTDLLPGVQVLTTTARDALVDVPTPATAGPDAYRWTGKTIFNTTTARLEVWNGAQWAAVAPGTALADAAPPAVADAGAIGASTDVAREDHTHALHPQTARKDTANIFTAASHQEIRRAAAADHAWAHRVTGDAVTRFRSAADGRLEWGDGVNSHDTNFYREIQGRLRTDGQLFAGSNIVVVGNTACFQGQRVGSPEGAVLAPVGSMILRSDGGAGTTLYVKESGVGNTGWRAMSAGGGKRVVDSVAGQFALPSQADGVSVVGSGTAWTFGAWAQVHAGFADALYIVGMMVRTAPDTAEIQIGRGASGAESIVHTLPLYLVTSGEGQRTPWVFAFPIPVPANVRLAARVAVGSGAGTAIGMKLLVIRQAHLEAMP